jgi:hypothetical protein
MTVSVAGRPIHHLASLAEPTRLVLDLIEGGWRWLEWAAHHHRARYHFDSQSALVAGIQAGLHASPFLLLLRLGLLVGPAKLMTLDTSDLRLVVRAEQGGAGTEAAALEQVREAGLVTQAELAASIDRLDQFGLAREPVFGAMSLNDQLAIHDLDLGEDRLFDHDLRAEAAAFAVGQARTPPEFVDYYRAYLQYVEAAPDIPDKPKLRTERVAEAVRILLPLLFHTLDCPRVDSASEVPGAIEEWLMMGRHLGFSRLSQAVQQVIAHTTFSEREFEDAPHIVARYLALAHALLASTELDDGRLGQDGVSRTFELRSDSEEAVVLLGPDGIVTLSVFRGFPTAHKTRPVTKRRK